MQLLHGRQLSRKAASAAPIRHLASLTFRPRIYVAQFPFHDYARRWYALDLGAIDKKWRKRWQEMREEAKPKPADVDKSKYILPMFPYPSGTLHLGHLRVYTIADVVARYHTLKGHQVMLPMGWDAFGLPAENAALERGTDPKKWTKSNITKMKKQLGEMNGSWDWDRELATCDPEFYKHTQKLFLMLFERGLAYQAEADVNWDPIDQTVLANEQVDANGLSWRSGGKVERRKLKQWFFKISEFREALLESLDRLGESGAWPDNVISQQRNWLGKSTGVTVKFPVLAMGHNIGSAIEVFTTRPDTLFGVQYIALASTHPTVTQLAAADPELQAFLDTLPGLPPDSKVGYLLPHIRAINPLAYHEKAPEATKDSLPVYVAPYVLGDYGVGAVMGVPGHDVRDNAFWKTHHDAQPIRMVLASSEDESTTALKNEPFLDHGIMTRHSGPFSGKPSTEAGEMIVKVLEKADLATRVEKWRLRDWLISRQRYWGTPIPIIHCNSCGPVPVPEEDLPVTLPDVDTHWAEKGTGNALESSSTFVKVECPKCKGLARRDTDTMDTFVDSSWYYVRFADTHNPKELVGSEAAKNLPVDIYIGGVEHAILHLLYARFIYKFLTTTPTLPLYSHEDKPFAEPFRQLITQGMVHGKTYTDPDTGKFLKPDEVDLQEPGQPKVAATGKFTTVSFEKMSKSKHNGVDPTTFISQYGADATRAHMLFQAPVNDVLNWDETKIVGVTRWLERLYDQVAEAAAAAAAASGKDSSSLKDYLINQGSKVDCMNPSELACWDANTMVWREVQRTITSVTDSYNQIYSLNTVISDLMTLTNTLGSSKQTSNLVKREALNAMIQMVAPIAPAFAEECWSLLSPSASSIFELASFPATEKDETLLRLLEPRIQSCAVQVNGKVRGVVHIAPPPAGLDGDGLKEYMIGQILATEEGKTRFGNDGAFDISKARRAIAVKGGKVINFVL